MTEVVVNSTSVNVTTVEETTDIVTVIATGPQGPIGPRGPEGGTVIGGYNVNVSNVATGDVLAFSGTNWVNDPQAHLTDGGNF